MKNKDYFLNALIANNGALNEIDLGEKIGLTEDETLEIIAQLLSEFKLEYVEHGRSNYRLTKNSR